MTIPHQPFPDHDPACRALADHFMGQEPTAVEADAVALAGLFQMVAEGFCGSLSPRRQSLDDDMAKLRDSMG